MFVVENVKILKNSGITGFVGCFNTNRKDGVYCLCGHENPLDGVCSHCGTKNDNAVYLGYFPSRVHFEFDKSLIDYDGINLSIKVIEYIAVERTDGTFAIEKHHGSYFKTDAGYKYYRPMLCPVLHGKNVGNAYFTSFGRYLLNESNYHDTFKKFLKENLNYFPLNLKEKFEEILKFEEIEMSTLLRGFFAKETNVKRVLNEYEKHPDVVRVILQRHEFDSGDIYHYSVDSFVRDKFTSKFLMELYLRNCKNYSTNYFNRRNEWYTACARAKTNEKNLDSFPKNVKNVLTYYFDNGILSVEGISFFANIENTSIFKEEYFMNFLKKYVLTFKDGISYIISDMETYFKESNVRLNEKTFDYKYYRSHKNSKLLEGLSKRNVQEIDMFIDMLSDDALSAHEKLAAFPRRKKNN